MSVNDEPGWGELAQDWAVAPVRDTGAVPLPSVAGVRRAARAQSRIFAGEMALCVVVLAVLTWRFLAGDGWTVTLAGVAFTVFAMLLSVWAWRLRPAVDAAPVRDALDVAIGQARAWVRWALAGYAVCVAAVAYLLFMLPDVRNGFVVVFASAYLLVALAITAWVHVRQRRHVARLLALRGELSDEA